MRVGSLFSGIGGLDLGLERAGMSVVWQCEADPYCRAVLRKHWPHVPCFEDVRDITADAPAVDLLCGGFPCQPVSFAGKGLAQADERWLWPEVARIVRALRPRVVLMENVPGLLARGMGDVLRDLAACGYDAEWDCIPAAAVGAPHLRYRVFIVGYADGVRRMGWRSTPSEGAGLGERAGLDAGPASSTATLAYTESVGLEGRSNGDGLHRSEGGDRSGESPRGGRREPTSDVADPTGPRRGSTRPAGPGSAEGPGSFDRATGPGWWAVEPDVGRVAYGVPSRVDRLRCLGNAVVPQVAEFVGRQVMRDLA